MKESSLFIELLLLSRFTSVNSHLAGLGLLEGGSTVTDQLMLFVGFILRET